MWLALSSHRGRHRSSKSGLEAPALGPKALGKPHVVSEYTLRLERKVAFHIARWALRLGHWGQALWKPRGTGPQARSWRSALFVCCVVFSFQALPLTHLSDINTPSPPTLCLSDLSGHLERMPILLTPRVGGGWISRGGTEAYYPVDVLVAHRTSTPLCLPYLQDLNPAQPPSLTLHAQSLQSCPTLCHSMDHSPPDPSVQEILQARTLEWVAVPPSRGSF